MILESGGVMSGGVLVKSIAGLSTFSMLLQTLPTPPIVMEPSYLDLLSKLGAQAILFLAVIALWRKLQEKDSILMENYKSMADALAANKATVEKMSETLDGIRDAVERMDTVREQLGRLPHSQHPPTGRQLSGNSEASPSR